MTNGGLCLPTIGSKVAGSPSLSTPFQAFHKILSFIDELDCLSRVKDPLIAKFWTKRVLCADFIWRKYAQIVYSLSRTCQIPCRRQTPRTPQRRQERPPQ